MWIVVFDFFLVLLLGAFFFYGINKWDSLILETEPARDCSSTDEPGMSAGRFVSLWYLVLGLGLVSMLSDLVNIFS